ncbi:uncharacterized protein DCS_04379 [Drechmeria coniospora]|uniref:Heparan-alpha-glucosaminide N-acetyltransferase catalytic domain-containing protein n=1 Tax=Drechmeria coniospora TaxID=98403 RepID=A0A151GJU1_DRECN|nr:uncharacterized protein DCS_04379 [Drechmeria coniospora]KYK57370.1 uncharacterized protein DCS_04379 [Drechmeria coniospora]
MTGADAGCGSGAGAEAPPSHGPLRPAHDPTSTDVDNPSADADDRSAKPRRDGRRGDPYGTFAAGNLLQSPVTEGPADEGPAPAREPSNAEAAKRPQRALAPDLLRGLLMLLMALDHTSISLHIWSHGTGRTSESDGIVVRHFNFPTAYVIRTLSHLCGAGFTFLLGMGVVYLGRSRKKLGWSTGRLVRYFAVRAAVLTLVSTVFGFVLTAGKVWFLNMVLFSLAVNYFLAGLLWLLFNKTETLLTETLLSGAKRGVGVTEEEDVEQPLLTQRGYDSTSISNTLAASVSWHFHNAMLLAMSIVTILWNIWLSENHGHCLSTPLMAQSSVGAQTIPQNPLLRIWFWPVMGLRVLSGFPPLAWLSFATLGLLYGRISVSKAWNPRTFAACHAFAAVLFATVFVLTRLLRWGNLSEGCLRTDAQQSHPGSNPYLVSATSFFYLVKYPPDVAFWSFTMAGNLGLLAFFGALPVRFASRLTLLLDLGTAALFFYILHILVIFALGMALVARFGHDTGIADPMDPGNTRGIDSLLVYFAFWAAAILLLWPLCRAYSRFKSRQSSDSIWRFF